MKRPMLSLVLTFALFAGAFLVNAPAGASHGAQYHWGGSGDRNVRIVDSTTNKWTAGVSAADTEWSVSPYVNLAVQDGPSGRSVRKKCAYEVGGVHVCNASYSGAWAGLAQVWFDGANHITKARARLNDRHVTNDRDRLVVACHEIGHTLGLDHQPQSTPDTCMTPVVSTGTTPNAHDFVALTNLYTHAHSSSSAAGGSEGSETVQIRKVGDQTLVTIAIYL